MFMVNVGKYISPMDPVGYNKKTNKDLDKVKYLLRYNNWQHDPLSAAGYQGPSEPRAPENAIAARYDLHPWPKVQELSN